VDPGADDHAALRGGAQRVEHELALMQKDSSRIEGRVKATQRQLRIQDTSVAPLANRSLKSVFTIVAGNHLGSAFVGWVDADSSYLITANHVVEGESRSVTIERRGGSWDAEVIGRDPKNDLALVRVDGHPQNAAPLWQKPRPARPQTGDELLLVGSPFGLGGTVTTGVVSRVGPRWVQTDAAANPGNSGGPAIDRNGRVVGVMLAIVRGGQNIGFAVRIERACQRLRRC
jgi:S1-C subfamily serine protease